MKYIQWTIGIARLTSCIRIDIRYGNQKSNHIKPIVEINQISSWIRLYLMHTISNPSIFFSLHGCIQLRFRYFHYPKAFSPCLHFTCRVFFSFFKILFTSSFIKNGTTGDEKKYNTSPCSAKLMFFSWSIMYRTFIYLSMEEKEQLAADTG